MNVAKAFARAVAWLFALPTYLLYRVARVLVDPERAFHDASQAVSLWPGLFGDYVRREFYRLALESCSADCSIAFGTILSKRGARIGRRVYIGTRCTLGLVTLEDDVLLASDVDILSGREQHRFDDLAIPVREQGGAYARVVIGRDAWIGERCVVMADVGEQAIVGAGSVVTKPIPPRAIAVGVPARVVGQRGEPRREPHEQSVPA